MNSLVSLAMHRFSIGTRLPEVKKRAFVRKEVMIFIWDHGGSLTKRTMPPASCNRYADPGP